MPLNPARVGPCEQMQSAQWALHRQKEPQRMSLWVMIGLNLTCYALIMHTSWPMHAR